MMECKKSSHKDNLHAHSDTSFHSMKNDLTILVMNFIHSHTVPNCSRVLLCNFFLLTDTCLTFYFSHDFFSSFLLVLLFLASCSKNFPRSVLFFCRFSWEADKVGSEPEFPERGSDRHQQLPVLGGGRHKSQEF